MITRCARYGYVMISIVQVMVSNLERNFVIIK